MPGNLPPLGRASRGWRNRAPPVDNRAMCPDEREHPVSLSDSTSVGGPGEASPTLSGPPGATAATVLEHSEPDQPDPATEMEPTHNLDAAPAMSVVVGVDGSAAANAAVAWATGEAGRRGLSLHILCARDGLMWSGMALGETPLPPELLAEDGTATVLDDAVAVARQIDPTLTVTTSSPWGNAAANLVEASKEAALVVVGSRGRTGLAATILGTTSIHTVAHAHSPAVILRHVSAHPGERLRVVVGVDGSEHSRQAVQFAFESAGAHGSVTMILAWKLEVMDGVVVTTPGSAQWEAAEEHHREVLLAALADLPERFPTVEVTMHSVRDRPAQALEEAAEKADLLVVGSRGHGGFVGLLLGSVSLRLIQSAPCPVAVTRAH